LVSIITPAWQHLRLHWAGFLPSSAVFWLCVFWAADWATGSALAVREGRFEPRRARLSVWKLLTWLAVLGIAWGLRDSKVLGTTWAGACLEAGVLLTEASSVVRNLALLSSSERVRKVLKVYADKIDQQ